VADNPFGDFLHIFILNEEVTSGAQAFAYIPAVSLLLMCRMLI